MSTIRFLHQRNITVISITKIPFSLSFSLMRYWNYYCSSFIYYFIIYLLLFSVHYSFISRVQKNSIQEMQKYTHRDKSEISDLKFRNEQTVLTLSSRTNSTRNEESCIKIAKKRTWLNLHYLDAKSDRAGEEADRYKRQRERCPNITNAK